MCKFISDIWINMWTQVLYLVVGVILVFLLTNGRLNSSLDDDSTSSSASSLELTTLQFDDFTIEKMATQIESAEYSIYRYFTNKYTLLAYIMMWYWSWMEYRMVLRTQNIY